MTGNIDYDASVDTLKRAHKAGIGSTIVDMSEFFLYHDTALVAHAFDCPQRPPSPDSAYKSNYLDMPTFMALHESLFCRECIDEGIREFEINLFSEERDDWNDLTLGELVSEFNLMLNPKARGPFETLTFDEKFSIIESIVGTRSTLSSAEYTRLGFPPELSSLSKIRNALIDDVKKNHVEKVKAYILSLYGPEEPELAGKFILVPAEGHPYGAYREDADVWSYHIAELFISLWDDQKTGCWQVSSLFGKFLTGHHVFKHSPHLTIDEPLNLEDLHTFSSLVANLEGKGKKKHQVMPSAYNSMLALRA